MGNGKWEMGNGKWEMERNATEAYPVGKLGICQVGWRALAHSRQLLMSEPVVRRWHSENASSPINPESHRGSQARPRPAVGVPETAPHIHSDTWIAIHGFRHSGQSAGRSHEKSPSDLGHPHRSLSMARGP
jgi:hypothetical protein